MKHFRWRQENEKNAREVAQELHPLNILVLVKVHHHEVKLFLALFIQVVVVKLVAHQTHLISKLYEVFPS
jgi:hypothetical protein